MSRQVPEKEADQGAASWPSAQARAAPTCASETTRHARLSGPWTVILATHVPSRRS
jgi:hypothetical protein